MNHFLYLLTSILIISLCACDLKPSGKGDGNEQSDDEFTQRSKFCQDLDAEKCAAESKCELIAKVCLPKLPTSFAIETVNAPLVADKLVGRKITALAKGPVDNLYVGTDDGLLIWAHNEKKVDRIEDFSDGNPALAGLKYVRAIGFSPLSQRAYASIGKNADDNDPDSKIIYEITQKDTFSTTPPVGLAITSIFESTPGVMVFGGQNDTRFDIYGANVLAIMNPAVQGVTASVHNPNGSNVWLGTGGNDATKHVGIRIYDPSFRAVPTGADGKVEPSVWGSSAAAPNANISSMAISGPYILVGLRTQKGNPHSGGIIVFNIYQPGKAHGGKPYLLGTDVKRIIATEFAHGDAQSGLKKKAIIVATDTEIFEATLKTDNIFEFSSINTTPINVDRQGRPVELKSVDHLFQQSSSTLYFSSDNTLYFVGVR